MTIKITFEYRTVEEAAIALGKLGGLLPTKDSAAPPVMPPIPQTVGEILPEKRRGRPRKNTPVGTPQATPHTSPEALPTLPAASTIAAPVEVAPHPVATENRQVESAEPVKLAAASLNVKLEDAQAGIERLFNAKGAETCMALLARYGAKRVRDMKPEQLPQLLTDIDRTISGQYNPIVGEPQTL